MNYLLMNLAKLELFEGITLGELEEIFSDFRNGLFSYDPGAIIKFRGDEYKELLILLIGEIEAVMQNSEGKTVIVETLKAPSILALAFLFSSQNILPVDIVVKKKSKILAIPRSKVLEFCQKNEKFLANLLREMGDKISFLAEKTYLFSLSDLKERVARYLLANLTNSKTLEIDFKLSITKEELSKILGVTRPSLSRVFSQLIKEGIISQERREVIIRDLEKLKKLIKE